MSSGKDHMDELRTLSEGAAEELTERSHTEFNTFLSEQLGFSEEDAPIPLEVCMGIAQGLADASGFRVVIQAAILEPIEGEPNRLQEVGHREVGAADPSLFVNPADRKK